MLGIYAAAEVTISAAGVCRFGSDEAAARRIFEFARDAGFSTVSADLQPGGLATAEKLCEEYGKRIAIQNHVSGGFFY